jgi:hypothetical protein
MYTTKTPANPHFLAFGFSQPTSSENLHLRDGTAIYAESVKTTLTKKI